MGAHRRRSAVLLIACLLLVTSRAQSQQREVIATAVPVTPSTNPAPAPLPPLTQSKPLPPPTAPKTNAIQQVAYTGDPPAPSGHGSPLVSPLAAFSNTTPQPPPSAPPPLAPPPAPPADNAATTVAVEVVTPDRLMLGSPLVYEIVLRNTGTRPAAEIHIEEALPAGARLLKSEPAATAREKSLCWDLPVLEAGAQKRLKVEMQPGAAGDLDLRPAVTFKTAGPKTKIMLPPFSVDVSADHTKVQRGESITFTLRVSNNSDAPVKNIILSDDLPAALHHPRGPNLEARLGDLVPHDTRTITLETTAVASGTIQNKVRAEADLGVEATAGVEIVITEPSLALKVDGPKQGTTQSELEYRLEVNNPTTMPAKDVRLVQALPPSFEVVAASTGANLDSKLHSLVWSLPDLSAGQRQTLTFRVKGSDAGDWPLYTALLTANLPEARVANVIHLDATAQLRLEVRAHEESLTIGGETTYKMHVFNHGAAPCSGLQLTVALPPEVTLVDAQGPTTSKVEGQQVCFAALQLPAKADTVYRLRVRGQKEGQGSVRAVVTDAKQQTVQKELSIQVHGGATVVNANSAAVEKLGAAK